MKISANSIVWMGTNTSGRRLERKGRSSFSLLCEGSGLMVFAGKPSEVKSKMAIIRKKINAEGYEDMLEIFSYLREI